jgi:DNA-binding NarL/FixJ family response regulator
MEPVARSGAEGSAASPASYWRRRVFRNTYTRGGRCIEIKGWSVKIQHHGTRRTFSLAAKNRMAAAVEAQAIYQTILTQGWDAAARDALRDAAPPHTQVVSDAPPLPKTDARYWKRRLLRRRPTSIANLTTSGEFSARIEHAGTSYYFPLGTLHEDSAAAKARDIYLAVVKDGWDTVNQWFPHEVTVAVHWADNPLAWTYATFHTVVEDLVPRTAFGASRRSRHVPVAVVESDASIRRALFRCVNSQDGFTCTATFASAKEALHGIPRCASHLVLVSRALPDITPNEFADRLRRLAPDLAVLFFAAYEDSDQLFKATPGGASGYLLKRTPPERLFEPVMEALEAETLSAERIALHVRRYFQNLIASLSGDDSAHDMAKLTHREHEILNLLSKGYVDKEIAEALTISIWTVHGHLKKIFEKLGVHTRTEAAIKYLHK